MRLAFRCSAVHAAAFLATSGPSNRCRASATLVAAAGVNTNPTVALVAARALKAPVPLLENGGEFEGGEFWEEHEELLKQAWRELPRRVPHLYEDGGSEAYQGRYVHPDMLRAVEDARNDANEARALDVFEEIVPGVFATERFFTEAFLDDVLAELHHVETSGIPRRRPNGMNRYGVILDQVGMEDSLAGLSSSLIRPLAGMLFPELVGPEDAVEHYAFTVRYESDGDTELAKHGDASVVTLNVCLGRPGWQGGELRFFNSGGSGIYRLPKGNESAGAGDVAFKPGMVLLHRGQHKHQALPLTEGERTNLIIWLMGRDGVVRVAPYPPDEQLSVADRWRPPSPSFRLEL